MIVLRYLRPWSLDPNNGETIRNKAHTPIMAKFNCIFSYYDSATLSPSLGRRIILEMTNYTEIGPFR